MEIYTSDGHLIEQDIATTTSCGKTHPFHDPTQWCALRTSETQNYADSSSTPCITCPVDLGPLHRHGLLPVHEISGDWVFPNDLVGQIFSKDTTQLLMHKDLGAVRADSYHQGSSLSTQSPTLPFQELLLSRNALDSTCGHDTQLMDTESSCTYCHQPTAFTTSENHMLMRQASRTMRQSPRIMRQEKGNRRYARYLRERARKEQRRQFTADDTAEAYCGRRNLLLEVIQREEENRLLKLCFSDVNSTTFQVEEWSSRDTLHRYGEIEVVDYNVLSSLNQFGYR